MLSSVGRAAPLQGVGREFETLSIHQGVVVQLVRIPACHAGGRGFESRPLRQDSSPVRFFHGAFPCALGMSGLYRVEVPKCRRWRQAHSQRQGLNREVPTEGSPRQTIDLTNRNGLRHMLSGKTARQVEARKPHGDGSVKTEGT